MQAKSFDGGQFFGVIGEQNHIGEAERTQALCADAVKFGVGGDAVDLVFIVFARAGEGRFEGVVVAVDVQKRAAAVCANAVEGVTKCVFVVVEAEQVVPNGAAVNADERRFVAIVEVPGQGEVRRAVGFALEGDGFKPFGDAVCERFFLGFGDERLAAQAVFNEIGNGDDRHAVYLCEDFEVGHARHRAVILHDFADDAGGDFRSCDAGEVDAAFGLANADENAAGACRNGKDVAGARQITRFAAFGRGKFHRVGAICRANAGGDAFRGLDAHVECRMKTARVVSSHRRDIEFFEALLGHREANQPAAIARHKIDVIGRDMFGEHAKIAFIFAMFVIDEDDHPALFENLNGIFDSGQHTVSNSQFTMRNAQLECKPQM